MVELRAAAVMLPPMVVDLVVALLAAHVDITVVARFPSYEGIDTALVEAAPNLILVGVLKVETDGIAAAFLRLVSGAKVVALARDGRAAAVHAADATATMLSDFSPRQLVEAILEDPSRLAM